MTKLVKFIDFKDEQFRNIEFIEVTKDELNFDKSISNILSLFRNI